MDLPALQQALVLAEAGAANVRDTAAALRRQLAPLRVVVVDAFDMRDEAPALSSPRHRVYLGASDGHCWGVTNDPALAAGLFLAERGVA
jgi:hypothetical protein